MSDPTESPLLSIIVISKDDPGGLNRTLNSIASQTWQDFEVVLVVKGGSVGAGIPTTLQACTIVREQRGSGISAAFNEAIDVAAGRWINFLNGGDAYLSPDSLAQVADDMHRDDAVLIACRARDESSGVMIPRAHSFRCRNIELVSHQASLFARALFARFGGYSTAYRIRMDFEWMLRMPDGLAVRWRDLTLVSFAGQGVSSIRPWRSCVEELRALREHRRGAQRIASLLLVYLPLRVLRAVWRRQRQSAPVAP
jgi:glycosyltransferase involved in cell wall biosynthesis